MFRDTLKVIKNQPRALCYNVAHNHRAVSGRVKQAQFKISTIKSTNQAGLGLNYSAVGSTEKKKPPWLPVSLVCIFIQLLRE